jgi:predicted Zn-dependent peptidase
MAAQTLQDLQAYARKYIVGKPMVVGVLLPPGVKWAYGITDADVLPRIVP